MNKLRHDKIISANRGFVSERLKFKLGTMIFYYSFMLAKSLSLRPLRSQNHLLVTKKFI